MIDGGNTGGEDVETTTGRLVISAVSGVGSGNALETEVGSLDVQNTSSGDIELSESDGVSVQRLLQAEDDSITLTAGGTITVASGGNGVVIDDTADGNGNGVITLTATAGSVAVDAAVRNDSDGAGANIAVDAQGTNSDVSVTSVITTAAGAVTLTADDSITLSATGAITATGGGAVVLTANDDNANGDSDDDIELTDGAVINGGSGTITISAAGTDGGNITLGRLVTTSASATAVTITTSAGVIDGGNTGGRDIDAVNGTVTINAVGSIGGTGTDIFKPTFDALEITAMNLTATAGGAIAVDAMVTNISLDAPTQFVTLADSKNVSGDSFTATSLALIMTSGTLTIGDITVAGDLRIEAPDIAAADGSIDLSAQRVLLKSDATETVSLTALTRDATGNPGDAGTDPGQFDGTTGGDLIVTNASDALVLADLDCDNVSVQTINPAGGAATGSITITTTGDLTVADDVIAGNDGETTSSGAITLTANAGAPNPGRILIGDIVQTDAAATTISADDDVQFIFVATGDSVDPFDASMGSLITTTGNVTVTADANGDANGSGGALTMVDGTLINAGSGTIDLDADESIFLGRLLTSSASLTAVTIDTTSGGVIDNGDTGDEDIDASSGRVVINAVLGVGATAGAGSDADIETDAGSLDIDNATSGDISIDETDAVTVFDAQQATAGNIELNADGTVTIDNSGAGVAVSTVGAGTITISAAGAASSLQVNDGVLSVTAAITLTADDDVVFEADGDISSTSGNVTVTADANGDANGSGGALTMVDGTLINAGSGTIDLDADESIFLGRLLTSSASLTAVTIDTTSGGVIDNGDTGDEDIDAANGRVVINAVTGIGTGNAIETQVASLDVDNVDQVGGRGAAGNIEIIEVDNLTIIHVDNDADATGSNDPDNGMVSITLQTGGDLLVMNDSVDDLANAAVQSESIVILTADDITINDDIVAVEDATLSVAGMAGDGTSVSESIRITAREDFVLMNGRSLSTDDDPTPGMSTDINRDPTTGLPIATSPADAMIVNDAVQIEAQGRVTLGEDIEIRTDHGVTRQIAPRPALFVTMDGNGDPIQAAFLQVESSLEMRAGLDASQLGRVDVTVGVLGEENLRVDVDWGVTPTDPPGFRLLAGAPDDSNFYSGDEARQSIYIVPTGGVEASIPHRYILAEILSSRRNGREINPLIVGVRFSVTQNESIVIAGDSVTDPDGSNEVDVATFTGTSEPFDVSNIANQLALLSSTDTDGILFDPTLVDAQTLVNVQQAGQGESVNVEAPSTGRAEWEFQTGGAPPQELLVDAVVVEAASPDPNARPSLVTIVEPLIPESAGAATASSAAQSQDFLEIRWNDGEESQQLTIEQGERLLSSPERLENYITSNSDIRQNTSYEIWTVTRIPQKGITIEQRVFEFEMSGGRLGPGTEFLPEAGEAIQPLELVPINPDGMKIPHPDADANQNAGPNEGDEADASADTPDDQGQAAVKDVLDVDAPNGANAADSASRTQLDSSAGNRVPESEGAVDRNSDQEQSAQVSDYNRSDASPAGAVALGITFGALARRRRQGSGPVEQEFSRAARLLRRVRRAGE